MSERKFFFQWQNEVLKKSIYPLREMKLRHVLEFDMEIYLWKIYKKYKDQELAKFPELASEVANYHEKRKAIIDKAVREYDDLVSYFTHTDVTEFYKTVIDKAATMADDLTSHFDQADMTALYRQEFPEEHIVEDEKDDEDNSSASALADKSKVVFEDAKVDAKDKVVINEMMAKINAIHHTFKQYFADLNDPRKESYFISQRLAEWDQAGKDLDHSIFLQMNRVTGIQQADPNHVKPENEENVLKALQNIVRPMLNEERTQLAALVATHDKLVIRKLDYAREVKKALAKVEEINKDLMPQKKLIDELKPQIKDIQAELDRFDRVLDLETVKKYYSPENILKRKEQIRDLCQLAHPSLVDKLIGVVSDMYQQMADIFDHINDTSVKLVSIRVVIKNIQFFAKVVEQGAVTLTAAQKKSETSAAAALNAQTLETIKENVLLVLGEELGKLNDCRFALQTPKPSKTKLSQDLKARQADLKTAEEKARELQKKINNLEVLHNTEAFYISNYIRIEPKIQDLIAQKMDEYRATLVDKDQYQLLAMIYDLFVEQPERYPLWLRYMIVHFSGMRYSSSHGSWADPRYLYMRLNNLAATNEDALKKLLREVEAQMTPEEALLKIQAMKDQLPPWMWKEIVAVTELRPNEVNETDPDIHNWERLTVPEQSEKNSPKSATHREIINAWKPKYLTSWREEHERAHRLIVRSSVCNEVAEHIQHLRGHKGAPGLSGKPNWYRGEENKYKALPDPKPTDDVPFFKWPRKIEDYRVGASILWLKYKNEPAFSWEAVEAMTTSEGDPLVPYVDSPNSLWNYKSGGLTRTNSVNRHSEYLFWIHEATVACQAETAEGNVVLTFETNLPYEDRRLAAVGLFKRNDYNLFFDGGEDAYNGSFLGYVPEKIYTVRRGDTLAAIAQRFETTAEKIMQENNLSDPKVLYIGQKLIIPGFPTHDLEEMLNWDHILLRS